MAHDPVDGETYFMLNTDFELFFDLDLDANGKATCILDPTCIAAGTCGKHNICPQAQTFDIGNNFIQVSDRNKYTNIEPPIDIVNSK